MSSNAVIIMLVYFNYDLVERSINSFTSQFQGDIIFIENPSIHSEKMRQIGKKYNICSHYICNENIGGCAIELFLRSNADMLKKYDYIAVTESDMVIEKGGINELFDILTNNIEIDIASIQLDIHLSKYKNLPTYLWVPPIEKYKNFYLGYTGFQFIMFRHNILYDFLQKLADKKHVNHIACGSNDFYGLSDTNLYDYIMKNEMKWAVTNTKGDHIGWEKYLDDAGNFSQSCDYCKEREQHLYYTRSNEVLDNIHKFFFMKIIDVHVLYAT